VAVALPGYVVLRITAGFFRRGLAGHGMEHWRNFEHLCEFLGSVLVILEEAEGLFRAGRGKKDGGDDEQKE